MLYSICHMKVNNFLLWHVKTCVGPSIVYFNECTWQKQGHRMLALGARCVELLLYHDRSSVRHRCLPLVLIVSSSSCIMHSMLVSMTLHVTQMYCNQGTSSIDTAPCTLCSMCRASPLWCMLDTCYAMLEFIHNELSSQRTLSSQRELWVLREVLSHCERTQAWHWWWQYC